MDNTKNQENLMEKVTALCKRRGFIYPGSEIYGGLANTYDYGPMGAELLRNIKNLWWEHFVHKRSDVLGLESSILMNPKVWEASGHTASFTDTLVDCKNCRLRIRADHLIEDYFLEDKGKELKVDGKTPEELNEIIQTDKIHCPKCNQFNWTSTRKFNQLFETKIGIVEDSQSLVYLRGEIAQGMFVNFKNVLDSFSPKLPFGLAQSGVAFRNEITLGKLIYRMLQFNLAEFEYFFDPEKNDWHELFEYWQKEMENWTVNALGLNKENIRWRAHTDQERSHYSERTADIEYKFPWGFKEMYGLAYRTDFDLRNHTEKSGVDLQYQDMETNRKFIPHVIEPTFGMDRSVLAVLMDSYSQDEVTGKVRVVLKMKPVLAPYKTAVFPLLANKPELVELARKVYLDLQKDFMVAWDERGNIGKRYASQDEIGTPLCITVDFQSLEDQTVTIRDRDDATQQRIAISELPKYITDKINL